MNPRSIILGVTIVAVSFIGATLAMNVLWPRSSATLKEGRPALVAVPPLKPLAGISTVLAPAAITMSAIGEALAEQVIDGKSKIDISSFSMKRFGDLIR